MTWHGPNRPCGCCCPSYLPRFINQTADYIDGTFGLSATSWTIDSDGRGASIAGPTAISLAIEAQSVPNNPLEHGKGFDLSFEFYADEDAIFGISVGGYYTHSGSDSSSPFWLVFDVDASEIFVARQWNFADGIYCVDIPKAVSITAETWHELRLLRRDGSANDLQVLIDDVEVARLTVEYSIAGGYLREVVSIINGFPVDDYEDPFSADELITDGRVSRTASTPTGGLQVRNLSAKRTSENHGKCSTAPDAWPGVNVANGANWDSEATIAGAGIAGLNGSYFPTHANERSFSLGITPVSGAVVDDIAGDWIFRIDEVEITRNYATGATPSSVWPKLYSNWMTLRVNGWAREIFPGSPDAFEMDYFIYRHLAEPSDYQAPITLTVANGDLVFAQKYGTAYGARYIPLDEILPSTFSIVIEVA